MTPRPLPDEPLAPRATLLLATRQATWALPLLVVAIAVAAAVREDSGTLAVVLVLLAVVTAVVACGVVPRLTTRRFRWTLREEELELVHGAVTEVRTLVPVTRIQHVDVRRTPVSRALGLADLVVHTAAGTTTVPALVDVRAVAARDRLADLARTPDEL